MILYAHYNTIIGIIVVLQRSLAFLERAFGMMQGPIFAGRFLETLAYRCAQNVGSGRVRSGFGETCEQEFLTNFGDHAVVAPKFRRSP